MSGSSDVVKTQGRVRCPVRSCLLLREGRESFITHMIVTHGYQRPGAGTLFDTLSAGAAIRQTRPTVVPMVVPASLRVLVPPPPPLPLPPPRPVSPPSPVRPSLPVPVVPEPEPVRPNPPVTVMDLARKALAQADGDRDEAVRLLVKWFHEDLPRWKTLMDDLLQQEAWRLVKAARATMKTAAPLRSVPARETVEGLKLLGAQAWMEAVVAGMAMPLGDATRQDLERGVECLNRTINHSIHQVRWLRLITGRLSSTNRVRDALREADLARYYREAKDQVS